MFFATVLIIMITLVNIIVYKLREIQEENFQPNIETPSMLGDQLCHPFSLAEIKLTTRDIDEAWVLGKGALNPMSKQGVREFWTEIEMLSKFRHSHLVSLIGYCDDGQEMILVYEYVLGGNLLDRLHSVDRVNDKSPLSWVQRLKLCIGPARALEYLHTGTSIQQRVIHEFLHTGTSIQQRVIHRDWRDVKTSNILLNENLEAKISDFGLSKISIANHSSFGISTNVKRTFGYLDPEYLLTGKLTRKSDVYSFVIVLFEVVCGQKAVDSSLEEEQRGLAGWARHCVKDGILDQIVDPNLAGQVLPNCLSAFAEIGDQCLHKSQRKCPTIAEVVAKLEFALALQQKTDPSAFDGIVFHTSGAINNQGISDSSINEEFACVRRTYDCQENTNYSTSGNILEHKNE